MQPFVNRGFKGAVRHRDNEKRHGKNRRNDQPLCEVFDLFFRCLLLGAECIRGAVNHRCAKAGLLDNVDYGCGWNRIRCGNDAGTACRKVYGRGDDSGRSSKLAFYAARTGSTGHPGDV